MSRWRRLGEALKVSLYPCPSKKWHPDRINVESWVMQREGSRWKSERYKGEFWPRFNLTSCGERANRAVRVDPEKAVAWRLIVVRCCIRTQLGTTFSDNVGSSDSWSWSWFSSPSPS